ncbi:hypothetical protein AK812_SmicGene13380 [Symbiodinium microadriaticum]|uniref:Methyltransferase FkbM domain-containing protein n=1 Tax=Symbiodinium microadriaticum TaxID=2951 RepID=A0A1Q9E8A8_SYMMI|nr:hypothetical protein AK812_SmicGene13380 [Symbiodinium microadriaticum]
MIRWACVCSGFLWCLGLADEIEALQATFGWKGGGIDRLRFFKERLGFEPRHVVDVGAHVGNWTRDAREVYPSADFLLIEANPEHADKLRATGERFEIALLTSQPRPKVVFHSTRCNVKTGASIFREQTPWYDYEICHQPLVLQSWTLDQVVQNSSSAGVACCDLVKADVQGAEIEVLRGGQRTLRNAQLVLLEASLLPYNEGAPRFSEPRQLSSVGTCLRNSSALWPRAGLKSWMSPMPPSPRSTLAL